MVNRPGAQKSLSNFQFFMSFEVNFTVRPVCCSSVSYTHLDYLNYPAFVLCQLDAKNKVFAVRMCKSSEQRRTQGDSGGRIALGLHRLRAGLYEIRQIGRRRVGKEC